MMNEIKERNAKELQNAKKHLAATKYILLVGIIAGAIVLFFNLLLSLVIFALFTCLWAVTTYISFMHCITLKDRNK